MTVAAPCTGWPLFRARNCRAGYSVQLFLWAELTETQLAPAARAWFCNALAQQRQWWDELRLRTTFAGIANKGKGLGHGGPRALRHKLNTVHMGNFLHFKGAPPLLMFSHKNHVSRTGKFIVVVHYFRKQSSFTHFCMLITGSWIRMARDGFLLCLSSGTLPVAVLWQFKENLGYKAAQEVRRGVKLQGK